VHGNVGIARVIEDGEINVNGFIGEKHVEPGLGHIRSKNIPQR
jgi:hypothetical protein